MFKKEKKIHQNIGEGLTLNAFLSAFSLPESKISCLWILAFHC